MGIPTVQLQWSHNWSMSYNFNGVYFQRCNLLTHTVHVHGSGVFGDYIIPDLPVTVGLGVFGGIF